jgi:hypothetical protein
MPKRPNRNKRIDAPHVRLYSWLLNSPAYLSLSCPARALLVEVTRLYNGRNNGQIGLSVRTASERCHVARGTAARAFAELQERGFIELVTKGAFSRKAPHASEWRLTFNTCDVTGELPSKASCDGAAKNKTRYQNIPSRDQSRATHRRESGRK